jgi:hypothetical protein
VRRLGAQRGQTTAEYLGLLVVVALIVTTIGASGLKDIVVTGMQAAVCQMFPDKNCAVSDEELARGDPDAGAPRTPIPDPDLPTIQRTATTATSACPNPQESTAHPARPPPDRRPSSCRPSRCPTEAR